MMKTVIATVYILLVATCWAEASFEIDFSDRESIVIQNNGPDPIRLSGRYYGESRIFIPSLRAEKKVKGVWESYPWDWCGTGRKVYTIKKGERFSFPYQYHHAKGHIKVHLLGKEHEFSNVEGHDLPSPSERKVRQVEKARRLEKEFYQIAEGSDVAKRIERLKGLQKQLTELSLDDLKRLKQKILVEIHHNENLLSHGITEQKVNQ